ncbi:Senescence_reg domain-containing protein [Cephalotus follicularis]|uniref:Senescence_reg domain-containing protein n=1 Tax=Cephalotus follicularis TaxID=3775 RepID=A0A1Q3CPP6_CEPFO|nr:Senescence_reg domain-containing protein [Cephalotus follicularis]
MVVNSNNSSNHHEHQHHARRVTSTHHQTSKKKKKKKTVPINIPDDVFQCGAGFVMEEDYDFEGEMIPPHVMLGRRIAGKMEFSVCTGNGRTLKGRDLSQVRNSILRMTGFLET